MPETETFVSNIVISLGGSPFEASLARNVVEVTVENSLHLSDMATIMITDQELKWIDDNRFTPGAALKIEAGHGNKLTQIFAGEIVEIEPVFTKERAPYLLVRAFDKLHRMTYGRYMRAFVNKTDIDVFREVAQEVGLSVDNQDAGGLSTLHQSLIQSGQTNLEFLQKRAAALGFLFYIQDDQLRCKPPSSSSNPINLQMYKDLSEFRPRLTTVGQVSEVKVRGWDQKTKKEVIGRVTSSSARPEIGVSTSGGAMAKSAFHIDVSLTVSAGTLSDQGEAQKLAQAIADDHESRYIQAEGSTSGNPKIRAGVKVNVSKVGDRFSGSYFVTTSTHRFDLTSGYTTSFGVSGMQPNSLLSILAPNDSQSDSGNNQSSGSGNYTFAVGIVTDNNDPDKLGRVKLKVPMVADNFSSDWARVVALDAGNKRGFYFIPEVNDEVLVCFLMGDINHPLVLGGLWNGQDTTPPTPSDAVASGKVVNRLIRSRTGHQILIDDTDDKGGITIKDKNGNSIVLTIDQDKLTITSKGDMTLDATGNLTLKTAKKLSIEAADKGEIKAMGLSLDGKTSNTEVKGMGVKVDGGAATVDVKGSMINLN
jgi:uncharacterized protein involved in type VI secretion and phage assembly